MKAMHMKMLSEVLEQIEDLASDQPIVKIEVEENEHGDIFYSVGISFSMPFVEEKTQG